MQKLVIVLLMLLVMTGCGGANEVEEAVLDKQKELEIYLDPAVAYTLMVETWQPLVEDIEKGEVGSFDDFAMDNNNFHVFQAQTIYDLITKEDPSGNMVYVDDLFIPVVSDEESYIKAIEVVKSDDTNKAYELIITETGEYLDLGYGFTRTSHFYMDDAGKLRLYQISGGFGKGDFNLKD